MSKLFKRLIVASVLIIILTHSSLSQAEEGTEETFGCIQLTVVGVCIWIICYYGNCEIDYTIKYGHFNPDAVIQIMNPEGINRVEDPKRVDDSENRNHNNLIYQEGFAIGHPLAGEILCPSLAEAGEAYFLSELDYFAWRWGGLDTFTTAAWVPGQREFGNWPTNTWGHVMPRTGWTVLYGEPKSSAVVAHRIGDIITREDQSHLYDDEIAEPAYFIEDNYFVFSPEGLQENTNEQGWFQMLAPETEPGCHVFGNNDIASVAAWDGGRVSKTGEYTYTLWRPYECCELGKGFLIDLDLNKFPNPLVTH